MFQFEMDEPYFVYKNKGDPSPRDEVIQEILDAGRIPFYISNSNNCGIFHKGKQQFTEEGQELAFTIMMIDYPPNKFLA